MQRYLRHVVPLIALPLLLAACSPPGGGASPTAGSGQSGRAGGRGTGGPVPVVTAVVEQRAVPVVLTEVGNVEAASSVQIRAQVTGQLSAIHFEEGQEVQAGQPLFSLDSRPFRAALQQAEAVLARDTAMLQNAIAQQSRSDTLLKRGLIARDQNDTQSASTAALTATVAADRAAVESARLNVQYADIKSPISGRTGTLGAHTGDLVRANDTAPLVVINQLSPIYVTFSVPGRYLSDIRRYQARNPLSVTASRPAGASSIGAAAADDSVAPRATGTGGVSAAAQAAAEGPARGVLSFVDNAVDSTTGTIRLKATFANADRWLWPGAFVQVALEVTTDANALLVPATAVQISQDGQYVFVVKPDRTVDMRTVKVERQLGDRVVIAEGLSAGEVVVTDGQLRLTPGIGVTERADSGGARGGAGGPGGARATGPGGR
jgi:multidrug efflux system membrane fusion protein